MRGLGRERHRDGEKEKRDGQETMGSSRTWDAAASVVDDSIRSWLDSGSSGENSMANSASSPSTFSPALSSSLTPGITTPIPVFTPTVTSCSPAASAIFANAAQGTPPIASMQAESTTAGDDDLQTDMTGSPILNLQPLSTTSDDLRAAAASESSTTSATHNTWITATSDEASLSGVTIMPFVTFGETSSTPSASATMSSDTPSTPSSHFLSSTIDSPSSTFSSIAGTSSALPHIVHVDGAASTGMARTVAGVTSGVVVIVLLILLSIFAYIRGGAMRGLSSNIHFPVFRSSHKAPPVSQSQENFFRRRGTAEGQPRDLENATATSGSHYDDQDEDWEQVDMRDARSGNMEKDNGEWLESWRRGRERMMSMRRPPELQFNPDLPLPPIVWEGAGRKT